MQPLGAERGERGEIEVLEDIEEHQRGDALPIGRQFHDVEPAIVGGDGRCHFAPVGGEIRAREPRAPGRKRRHDVFRHALIERARAVGRDRRQGRRERREAHDVARPRRLPVHEIVPRCARVGAQTRGEERPVGGDARRDRDAALGETDRRRQRAVEAEPAVRGEHRVPRFDRAGHRDRMHGIEPDGGNAGVDESFGLGAGSRAAGAVVAPQRRAGLCDDSEAVAADAGHVGLGDAERRHRRHRRIGCRAAGA